MNAISESLMASIVYSLVRDAGRTNHLRPKGMPIGVLFGRLQGLDGLFVGLFNEADVLNDE